MVLENFSVEKLHKISKKRKIIVFGAGRNCKIFFEKYASWGIGRHIAYIVDNSFEK